MREGKLYINNLDAYATYGVFLANDRGGTYDNLSALMTPPPVKKYTTVDYRERDGEEVDVTLPRYEARDVQGVCRCLEIRYAQRACHRDGKDIQALLPELSGHGDEDTAPDDRQAGGHVDRQVQGA